jgi:hypothetical protein
VQQRCPRLDQLSPASSAHRGGRAATSPLLRASARLRQRARDGASASGLANASQPWSARARTTRHARTCPPCPCAHNAARPHLQQCDRGVDGPGSRCRRSPGGRRGGGHVACPPAAGRVSDPSTEVQTPARHNHRGQGIGHLPFYTHVTGVPRPTAHNAARPHLQRPQVKHFLGCKKSTKSNTCGSLFRRSGALLF